MFRTLRARAWLAGAILLLPLAACGSDDDAADTTAAPSAETTAPAGGSAPTDDLAAACGTDTIVIQLDWFPEVEHHIPFQLLTRGTPAIDKGSQSVSGPLIIDGADTGLTLEVRAGGGAVSWQSIETLMQTDQSITLGLVGTDGALTASGTYPLVNVMSGMTYSPQMIMWDPGTYPDVHTIEDIGASGATIVVSAGMAITQVLVGKGVLEAGQIDESYDGSPARFVANPSTMQQGYATAEPYIYEHEVPEWGKPIDYALLKDSGFAIYPGAFTARAGDVDEKAACFEQLIPALQQAAVDYFADPAAANELIVQAVEEFDSGWVYSAGVADFAYQQLKDLGISTNGPEGFGSFDMERVQQVIDDEGPVLADQGAVLKDGVTPEDIATNQFIDPAIVLPAS